MNLVIVESPSKCKTIESYLGKNYKCIATYGHLRELKSLEQIKFIKNEYRLYFTEITTSYKKAQIMKLKDAIMAATNIILATDDDREGEAIAWHICDMFNLPLNTKRIVFHEITQTSILHAINTPRTINMNLVKAQQTRQIIDLFVGFTITPILWKYISFNKDNPLSAGRCQTPTLQLIFDNDDKNNTTETSTIKYKCIGNFFLTNGKIHRNYDFQLNNIFLSNDNSSNILLEQEITSFLENSILYKHTFKELTKSSPSNISSPLPLTTSTLQQEANIQLHMSVKNTMKIAQSLYEKGSITYLRTDMAKFSSTFISQTVSYIENKWGENYVNPHIAIITSDNEIQSKENKQNKKNKESKQTQDAHEAIRPTNIYMTPEEYSKTNSNIYEQRLYKLIWNCSMEACMADAIVESATFKINALHNYIYEYKLSNYIFMGWKIVKNNSNNVYSEDDLKEISTYDWTFINECEKYYTLKNSTMLINYETIKIEPIINKTNRHLSEANIVKILETKGIGRPSTFSSLIDKIIEREYVKLSDIEPQNIEINEYSIISDAVNKKISENIKQKELIHVIKKKVNKLVGAEKNKLILQPIGRIVCDFLTKYFHPLLNYDYTKYMEESLDLIEKGIKNTTSVCDECNNTLELCLKNISSLQLTKLQHLFIFNKNISDNISDTYTLVITRNGPVICWYSALNNTKTYISLKPEYLNKFNLNMFDDIKNGIITLENIIDISLLNNNDNEDDIQNIDLKVYSDNKQFFGKYKENDVYIKNGKFGYFISLESVVETLPTTIPAKVSRGRPKKNVPIVKATISLKETNKNINEYTLQEIIKIIEANEIDKKDKIQRQLSENISIRKGPSESLYIYYKTPKMKSPKFYKLRGFLEDPITCSHNSLEEWIFKKYGIK